MSNRVLLIIPTKGRPEKHLEFYESFKDNSTITDLVFVLSLGDIEYPKIPGIKYETVDSPTMNGKLNTIANKYANNYYYIAFMGDDNRIRTNNWDVSLVNTIKDIKYGIAYGNDLFQKENLPTTVLLDAEIVRKLGYISPPALNHLYIDNFWRDLGKNLGTLKYREDVVIEHLHFINGKAIMDSTYELTNNQKMYEKDKLIYKEYLENDFENDLIKIRK